MTTENRSSGSNGVETINDARLRARWQRAVIEVTEALLGGTEPDQIIRLVAGTAKRLIDGDVVTVGVPHVPGQSLQLRVAEGYRADDLEGSIFPVEESLSGEVIASRDGLLLEDATGAPNAYQPICELGDMGPTIIVPLTARHQPFGSLLVARRRGRAAYTDDDLALLASFADHVSVAIEYGRTQEALQRLAVVEERERIGRELHDTVIQRLFATGLVLQSIAQQLEERAPTQARRIDESASTLNDIIADIRSTIFALRE